MAEVKIIYSDGNFQDIGILKDYKLDLAYGADENTFELTMPISQAALQVGYYIYNEDDGNIGGRVTKIRIDTANNTIKYKGDTWHGILAKHVIEPQARQDYQIVSGGADRVIFDLLTLAGIPNLNPLFAAYEEDRSGITITNYPIRYGDLYTVLTDMLYQYNAKLKMDIEYIDGYKRWFVRLSAEKLVNYANDEEWSSSQRDFVAEKDYQPVNHMICLGAGTLRDRIVIHLFSDGAKIMPYSTVEHPVRDSQYIRDKRNKVLTGINEHTVVFDYPNAQVRKGYMQLASIPADWYGRYTKYYYYEDGEYKQYEGVPHTEYRILDVKPANWETNAGDYYLLVDGEYKKVSDTDDYYSLLSTEPARWDLVFSDFYEKSGNDYVEVKGVPGNVYAKIHESEARPTWESEYMYYYKRVGETEYQAITPVERYRYLPYAGSIAPANWNYAYNNYYQVDIWGNYTPYEGVPKVINGVSQMVAPAFISGNCYIRDTYMGAPDISLFYDNLYRIVTGTVAPTWEANKYYIRRIIDQSPTFYANTFYQRRDSTLAPAFGVAYEYVDDNYADLVENALKRFNDYLNCDKINITLSPSEQYDIGDIVGATDDITGLSVIAPITKKIVKISKNRKTVSYETGGERT